MQIRPVLTAIALAAGASLAQAQSVEVFGLLDVALLSTSAGGGISQNSLTTDGNTSSRLGFRGTESLGGDLKANFWLEAAVAPDSGIGGSTSTDNIGSVAASGLTFGRRATVGVSGNWGEVRLGRDYTPSFNNLTTSMHPFGTNGLGNAGQMYYPVAAGGTTARTQVRASNSVGYHLPKMGGVYGQVMVAMGEQQSDAVGGTSPGNYTGARIGYQDGPLNLAVSSGTTNYATGDYTQSNFGINYKFGPAKLMYLWGENKVGVTKTTMNMVGTQYAFGPGEIRFAYTELAANGFAATSVVQDANQWAIGYVYDMSKRTALYTNYSEVKNKGIGKQFTVGDGLKPLDAGGSATGYQFGIRHSF